MRSHRPATILLCGAMWIMVAGFVVHALAQSGPMPFSQDGLNAMLFERMRAINDRQDNIEGMLKIGMTAIMMNLGAHLFTIWNTRAERKKRDEE